MWVLLVWLNEKIINGYKSIKSIYKKRKSNKVYVQQMMLSRKLPEYLRRDMGLPPYCSRHENDKNKP